jgi:argininosuccinate synthase
MVSPTTSHALNALSLTLDNLVHCSYEAGVLEDPDHTPPKELWT